MSLRECRNVTVLDVAPVGQSKMAGELMELRLELPGWDSWKPGQFVMVRPVDWELDLLWARPFSISSADDRSMTLLIQKTGRGTRRLGELQPGDKVTVWGPLGNGFAMAADRPTLLMAGGVGIAPFRGYVENHPASENLHLFFAHRLPLDCYPFEALRRTVAGESTMERGPEDLAAIIAAMGERIAEFAARDGLILACGPTPFMRTVQRFAAESGARAQLSLENRMACGVGACLGCVTKNGKDQHVQVCTRGPVFWSDDVVL